MSATDPSEPVRKLPFVEKQNRLETQKRRISGLSHRPEQQPAHQLIDQVYNLIESGAIIYIHPSKCLSREHEIQNEARQKTKQIVTLEQGSLKTTTANAMGDIDTSTELKLYFALLRRHLAFEMLNLLSWELCQLWLDKLMTVLISETPSNFSAVGVTQILKADREMFTLLAMEHTDGLKAVPGREPPLDKTFRRLMHDPRINVHLIAYPKQQPVMPKAAPKRPGDEPGDKPSPKKPRHTPQKPAPQMPTELKGLTTRTADGKPICWHRNLKKGCNNTVKNGRCRFGMHVCMKCLKAGHGAADCPG